MTWKKHLSPGTGVTCLDFFGHERGWISFSLPFDTSCCVFTVILSLPAFPSFLSDKHSIPSPLSFPDFPSFLPTFSLNLCSLSLSGFRGERERVHEMCSSQVTGLFYFISLFIGRLLQSCFLPFLCKNRWRTSFQFFPSLSFVLLWKKLFYGLDFNSSSWQRNESRKQECSIVFEWRLEDWMIQKQTWMTWKHKRKTRDSIFRA